MTSTCSSNTRSALCECRGAGSNLGAARASIAVLCITGEMVIKVVFHGVGSVRLAMFQHYASMMADDKPGSSVARCGNLMTHLKDPGYHSHLAMTALNRKPNQKCHRNQRASA